MWLNWQGRPTYWQRVLEEWWKEIGKVRLPIGKEHWETGGIPTGREYLESDGAKLAK